MWGLEHGVNEHGVAIGNEKVWTVDDPRRRRHCWAWTSCASGSSGEGPPRVRSTPWWRCSRPTGKAVEDGHDEPYWSSFLVVDGRGGWVLETSGRSWVAQPVVTAAISNRLTLSTGWARSSSDVAPGADWDERRAPDVPTGIADHRLAATRACVARGTPLTPAEAVATLRDHGTGPWGAPPHRWSRRRRLRRARCGPTGPA